MPSAIDDISGKAPPILDFSAFHSPDPAVKNKLISHIRAACVAKGFFQLTNHGVPAAVQDDLLAASKDFFSLPLPTKQKLDKSQNNYGRGYENIGTQMLETGTNPESKEGLYLGRDLSMDHPDVVAGKFSCGPNLWPEELGKGFQDACMRYHSHVQTLAIDVMKALALSLDLDENFFLPFAQNPIGTLRLIHYPPSATTDPKSRGIGAHRDFGCLTLLMQDEVGGLQVQDEATEQWIDVVPVPHAYVVNLGNMMMQWTNNKYTSNMHRVINKSGKDRYSMPFFFNGNPDLEFDCIPGCEDEGYAGQGKKSAHGKGTVADYIRAQYVRSYDLGRKA